VSPISIDYLRFEDLKKKQEQLQIDYIK